MHSDHDFTQCHVASLLHFDIFLLCMLLLQLPLKSTISITSYKFIIISSTFIKTCFVIYSGVYWVATPSGPVETFCDMANGGWTLIGQTDGDTGNKYQTWLRSNHNVANLATPVIEGSTYSCLDAVNMAVNYATEVVLLL